MAGPPENSHHEISSSAAETMRIALKDLRLDSLDVVHAGRKAYQLARNVRALPLAAVPKTLRPLRS